MKNYFLTSDRSLTRKFKEIIISVKIDQQQGKDQILENYLNTIYYGRGAYGIQTASKAYFNKDVSQLSVARGRPWAIVNAPSLYDPALGDKQKANLTSRVAYVLDGMVAAGWLSQADRDKVTGPAETVPPSKNTAIAGPNGYIVDAVRKELGGTLRLSDSTSTAGLRITTTINKASQDAAVAAVQKYLPKRHRTSRPDSPRSSRETARSWRCTGRGLPEASAEFGHRRDHAGGLDVQAVRDHRWAAAGHQHQDDVQREQPHHRGHHEGPE